MAKKPIAKKRETNIYGNRGLAESIEKSIPDQIYEELIKSIKTSGKFDSDSLNKLEAIVASGGIKKPTEVIRAIKKTVEK